MRVPVLPERSSRNVSQFIAYELRYYQDACSDFWLVVLLVIWIFSGKNLMRKCARLHFSLIQFRAHLDQFCLQLLPDLVFRFAVVENLAITSGLDHERGHMLTECL